MSRPKISLLVVALTILGMALVGPASAKAEYVFEDFDARALTSDGGYEARSGAHPFVWTVGFRSNETVDPIFGYRIVEENVKNIITDMPPGLVGDPTVADTCSTDQIAVVPTTCPVDSQIGTIQIEFAPGASEPLLQAYPVFRMKEGRGQLARFAFNPQTGTPIEFVASVRTDGDYGIRTEFKNISEGQGYLSTRLTMWGVPGDPAHDAQRGNDWVCFGSVDPANCIGGGRPSGLEPRPFMTMPARCGEMGPTDFAVTTWRNPGLEVWTDFSHPDPLAACEAQDFQPSISVQADSSQPDAPTGLSVDMRFPQDESPAGLATPPLKDATVTLPDGMTISPGSADGLQACSDAELGLGSNSPVACPDGSRIGTVSATTPALDEILQGGVFVRSQASDDPQSGDMFRIALVLESKERGLLIKLPGKVRANSETGRLETTFEDNPQLPVSSISLRLKGGPRAPLANSPRCGPQVSSAELTSWGGQVAALTDSFELDCPGAVGFDPGFAAGSVTPVGGEFSPFVARIDRGDRQQYLSGVSVEMPDGLLAKLQGVPLCGPLAAAEGGCAAGSRIGTATVAAGPGSNPFYLTGDAYLTEGYRGGAYGMAVHVHAKAGPYDLGWVRVRQAIHVDPVTTALTVVSDPLPQIVKGVPVRLRTIDVAIDREQFTVNPTSCAEQRVDATLTSIDGAVQRTGTRYRVADCQALGFSPRLALRLTARKQRRTGGHPGLRASLVQKPGQANIRRVQVKLPKSLALDPKNANGLCSYDEGLKVSGGAVGCPASSIVGRAVAHSPLLNRPLTGNVYFVEHKRRTPQGNLVSALPSLLVALRGEVAVDLRARSSVRGGRLVSTFGFVPDAAVSRFDLSLRGGKGGILVVTRNRKARFDVCRGRHVAAVAIDGQNGKTADRAVRAKSPCKAR